MPTRRSNEERKKIYNYFKRRNFAEFECRRLRDWTKNHLDLFLTSRGRKPLRLKISPIYRGG